MNLHNKRILITGGAGFIGSHLADELIKMGARVSIIDNLTTGLKENINPLAKFYEMDINDKGINEIFRKERPEIVYLLAFNTIVPRAVIDPLFDLESLRGNLNVIIAAHNINAKKIILASSGFVYGNTQKIPTKEIEKIIPDNPYIITKAASEDYLHFFYKAYQQKFVILRYATVYGPRQIGGAMADYIRSIKSGRSAIIYGDGKKTRDYIYIEDVIKANILALSFNNYNRVTPIFNISTGEETSLNQLYGKISVMLNKKNKPTYLPDRQGELIRFSLSNNKAKKYLKWQPIIDLDSGLKKTLNTSL